MSLWQDEEVRMLLVMGDKFSKPLYELAPHIFSSGYMNEVEQILWTHYYKYKAEITNG